MTLKKKKILLVDGSGFIFRAFHAIPTLNRKDGTNVNALFGFINMVLKLKEDIARDALIYICFDAKRKNFRHDLYHEYKANRSEMPEDLIPQLELIKEFCHSMGFVNVVKEGVEADDLIASFCDLYKNKDADVVVVTSDKDLLQLMNIPNVCVYDPYKQSYLSEEYVQKKFGVDSSKIVLVQALAGDSADNIPGAPGIGVKTAALLINEYNDLENLFAKVDSIIQPKRRSAIEDNIDLIKISHQLVSLKYDVDLSDVITDFDAMPQVQEDQLLQLLLENDFSSIIGRLKSKGFFAQVNESMSVKPLEKDLQSVSLIYNSQEFLQLARINGFVTMFVDVEGSVLSTENQESGGVLALMLPQPKNGPKDGNHSDLIQLMQTNNFSDLTPLSVVKFLQELIGDIGINKVFFDLKSQLHLINEIYGCGLDELLLHKTYVHDIESMANILNNNHANITKEYVLAAYLVVCEKIKWHFDKKSLNNPLGSDSYGLNEAQKSNIYNASAILLAYQDLRHEIFQNKSNALYYDLELPVLSIAYEMEKTGFLIDSNSLLELKEQFTKEIKATEDKIFHISGEAFNIGSPKQLSQVLFEKLLIPMPKSSTKGKSGVRKTDVNVLIDLSRDGFEIADHILNWRHFNKLKSTYTDSLIEKISVKSGRLHSCFLTNNTLTGRFASREPNLQNIPTKTEDGALIRKVFIAPKNRLLLSLDYSQIELRILSHFSKDQNLINAFHNNQDIHTISASQIFQIPSDEVTKAQRDIAKTINFSIIYGISPYGLSSRLQIGNSEAKNYIDVYFQQYSGIKDYIERSKQEAKDQGFVTTILGRKCHIKDILSKNYNLKALSERQAINAKIQGSASDLIKKAMILLHKDLEKRSVNSKLLLQVHDELILEIDDTININSDLVTRWRNIMEDAIQFIVPLKVVAKIGKNWSETHK